MTPTAKIRHAIILLIGIALPTMITWFYFVASQDSAAWIQQTAYGTGKLMQLLLPILAVWLATDREFSFHWPRVQGVVTGVVFGLLVVGLMLWIYHGRMSGHPMLDGLRQNVLDKVTGFGVDAGWKFLIMGLWYSVFHSLFEEYYWRWFVFPQCQRFLPMWAAIAVSSLGFMAHHVLVLGFYLGWSNLFTYQISICIAVGGAFWAWLYHKTQSLYPVWISHGIVDAGIFWMGYLIVKDSF